MQVETIKNTIQNDQGKVTDDNDNYELRKKKEENDENDDETMTMI